jgi:hypothetical protein
MANPEEPGRRRGNIRQRGSSLHTVSSRYQASSSARLGVGERYLGDDISRVEIMERLSQTYGPVFVEALRSISHNPGDAMNRIRASVGSAW